ncbi:MAG: DUF2267 domain-containing protein [Chitinispirillaceae bacterium]
MTTMTGLSVFDSTIQKSNLWLNEIMDELNWNSRQRAYLALRAVLHTLRDTMSVDEAANFSAQLPMLIRGIFYEDWQPSYAHVGSISREEFLTRIRSYFKDDLQIDAEPIVRAVFTMLDKKISEGETKKLKQMLPAQILAFWKPMGD